MAATAAPHTPVRDDVPHGPRMPHAPHAPDGVHRSQPPRITDASVEGFDDLFVQPVDAHDGRGSLPALPDGWRHAGLVELVARQPRERRETILAGAFALSAAVWAPLGLFAFMTRNGLLFGALSLIAGILAVAPRPLTVSQAVGDVADRAGPALDRVGPALTSTRERLAPLMARLRELSARAMPVLRDLGDRALPVLRTVVGRVMAALNDVGGRVAERVRSADRRVSAAVRRGLEGLHAGGGRDQSTPSSAR